MTTGYFTLGIRDILLPTGAFNFTRGHSTYLVLLIALVVPVLYCTGTVQVINLRLKKLKKAQIPPAATEFSNDPPAARGEVSTPVQLLGRGRVQIGEKGKPQHTLAHSAGPATPGLKESGLRRKQHVFEGKPTCLEVRA